MNNKVKCYCFSKYMFYKSIYIINNKRHKVAGASIGRNFIKWDVNSVSRDEIRYEKIRKKNLVTKIFYKLLVLGDFA